MAFRVPGGLQQLSYQMTMGDSDRAGSDLHTLCIHLHTPRCQPGPHLLLILLQGGEEGGSSCPLEKRERAGSSRAGPLPGPRRAGPALLWSGIPRETCQWAGELCLSLGVGVPLKSSAHCASEVALWLGLSLSHSVFCYG